jgi:phage gp29-like protein
VTRKARTKAAPQKVEQRRERLRLWAPQQLSRWSVAAIRGALTEHESGQFSRSALLADNMGRNSRIFAALQTRTHAFSALEFSIEPSTDGDQRRAARVAAELDDRWYSIAPEDVLAELLRSAVTCGVGVAEIVWTTNGDRWSPTLYPVPASLLWWDDTARAWCVSTETGIEFVTHGDGRWLTIAHSSVRPWMLGVVRCLGLEDKIRTEAVKDWARWSERHGSPLVLAKTPARASEDDKTSFYDSLSNVGGGGTTVLVPQGDTPGTSFDIDLLEAKSDGWQGFERLLSLVADDASIAILGQNLTQETKSGSLAAAKVHDRVRNDLLKADAEVIETALRRDVLGPWALFNFGSLDLAPWPDWDAEIPEDVSATVQSWNAAAAAVAAWRAQGVEVDVKEVSERVGLPVLSIGPPPSPPAPAAQGDNSNGTPTSNA